MLRIALVIILVFTSCATHNQQVYASVDQMNKSILVDIGSLGALGEVKKALIADGWRLVVMDGVNVTKGITSPNVRLEESRVYNVRYRLTIEERREQALDGSMLITEYDIAIVDLKSGTELLTISGRDLFGASNNTIAERLMDALRASGASRSTPQAIR